MVVKNQSLYKNDVISASGFEDPVKVDAVVMDGGLNYASSKSLLKPGTLSDCLNYEVVDRTGYRSIDGFLRYDGSGHIKDEDIFYIHSTDASTVMSGTLVGKMLYVTGKYSNNYPFGILMGYHSVSSSDNYVFYLRTDLKYEPEIGDTVRLENVSGLSFNFLNAGNPDKWTNAATFTPASWSPAYAAYYSGESVSSSRNLCGYISAFYTTYYRPGSYNSPFPFMSSQGDGFYPRMGTPVAGLHWFKDNLYAVHDPHYLDVNNLLVQPNVGDTFTIVNGGGTFPKHGQIVYAELLTGTWTGGTTGDTARVWYKMTDTNYDPVATSIRKLGDIGISYNSLVSQYLQLDKNNTKFCDVVVGQSYTANAPIALMSKSLSEQQAYDEGMVVSIEVTAGGAGYTRPPTVAITGGGGVGATAYAVISGAGAVTGVYMLSRGKGYTSTPTVTLSGGGGAAATAAAHLSTWRDCGFRTLDTGWQINFTTGNSKSGYLTKINRNNNPTSQITTYSATSTSTATPAGRSNKILTNLNFEGSNQSGASGTGWVPYTGNIMDPTFTNTNADGKYVFTTLYDAFFQNSTGKTQTVGFIDINGLHSNLPENAVIRGIEVTLNAAANGGFSSAPATYQLRTTLFKSTTNAATGGRTETRLGNSKIVNIANHAAAQKFGGGYPTSTTTGGTAFTLGGDGDLWGNLGLSYADLQDPGFGVAFDLTLTPASGSTFSFGWYIDEVIVKIYYANPSSRYYFADGTGVNIVQADLVDYTVSDGNFVRGDASGVMQLANVVPYATSATPVHTIKSGWKVYADSGLTAQVAVVGSTDMTYNGLESRYQIVTAGTMYQFITANFYANEEWRAMYGCSGAGRAFTFDGNYFQRIYAINPAETDSTTKDKPKFLAFFRFTLALGYPQGSVLRSVPGEPTNFSGLDGAMEIGVGDKITGLSLLQGEYLGVFGENSVQGIVADSVELKVLVPAAGAIAYTVCSIGERTIFCNSKGISTLDQSASYGDFEGSRYSYNVTPWLLKRVNTTDNIFSAGNAVGIVLAYPVRSKNQYRIWFKDGYQLTMTLVGAEQDPQFTHRRYVTDTATYDSSYTSTVTNMNLSPAGSNYPYLQGAGSTLTNKFYPLSVCSQVDSHGKERLFFSMDNSALKFSSSTPSSYKGTTFVYAIDEGWGFDTGVIVLPIPATLTTNHYFFDNPYSSHTIQKVRVEGSSKGAGDIVISTNKNYTLPTITSTTKVNKVSLPPAYPTAIYDDQTATSCIASVAETDRNILIRLDTGTPDKLTTLVSNFGLVTDFPQPPHYVQLMLVQFTEGKPDA